MKVVHKSQTKQFKNSPVCVGIEFPLGDKEINGAIAEIRGRYPDKGWVVNLKCKELAYVLKGNGKIATENEEIKFNQGDLLLIYPKEKYYWEGNCDLFMACTPAWYPEQHKEVE